MILSGGLNASTTSARRSPPCVRLPSTWPAASSAAPGAQGPGQARGVRGGRARGWSGAGPPWVPRERGRASVRPLRRPVRARDADARAGRARGGVGRGLRRTRRSGPSSTRCCATTSGGPRRCTWPRRLSEAAGHPVYLKREDLNHTGAHKINNALGQALLARRMGKRRIIAETGAGQHGVATATACALLDLDCVVYMGTEDMRRQKPNVERMRLLGASVEPVDGGRPHAQGGRLGRDPRLGHQRRDHPLHHRLVRRAGALPGAGAGPAAGDRRRGTGADPARGGPACPSG